MEQTLTKPMPTIDEVEARLLALGGQAQAPGKVLDDFPVEHTFTPGLYTRTILMPAGSIVTSRIHLTEHPFIVSKGRCLVYTPGEGAVAITAPHLGITKPGTRRVLLMLEDTIWTTFHPTDLTDPAEIDAEILAPMPKMMLEAAGLKEIT